MEADYHKVVRRVRPRIKLPPRALPPTSSRASFLLLAVRWSHESALPASLAAWQCESKRRNHAGTSAPAAENTATPSDCFLGLWQRKPAARGFAGEASSDCRLAPRLSPKRRAGPPP